MRGAGLCIQRSAVDMIRTNNWVRQRGSDPEVPGFEPTLATRVRIRGEQANCNHLNEDVAGAVSEEHESRVAG